jgi:hypothetical protein
MTEQADDTRGWRALPPLFVLSIVTSIAGMLMYLVSEIAEPGEKWITKIMLTGTGLHFASAALAAAGVYELARRSAGRARLALVAATWAFVAGAVMALSWDWIFTLWQPGVDSSFEKLYSVLRWTSFSFASVAAIALALAAWVRPPLAIAGLVLAIAGDPPPPVFEWVTKAFDFSRSSYYKFETVMQLLVTGGIVLLAITAARGSAAVDVRRATTGLRRIGGALKLRVVAALVGSGLMILLMLGSNGGEGAIGMLKLALMSAAVLNAIAQIMMSTGAMAATSAELADLPRWALAVASGLSLWCTGVMLVQVPHIYSMLYGRDHSMYGEKSFADALSLALPLAVTAAVAIVAGTIGAFASRRGDSHLGTQASGKGVGFVGLMLASIAITSWILPEAKSESGLMMMMLCAAAAGLWGTVLASQLCHLGADAIEAEPGLPSAKIVG